MSKKHRQFRAHWGVSGDAMVALLQTRARCLAIAQGHSLGVWVEAKRKYGKGAKRASCVHCGVKAIVMPYGHQGGPPAAQTNPVIMGDGVLTPCVESLLQQLDKLELAHL